MSAPDAALDAFRARIAARLGLGFEEARGDFLAGVLRDRLAGWPRGDAQAYLRRLDDGSDGEWERLAEALTITETYFFRNADHFRALTEAALPALPARPDGSRRVRILSAGCASGEEAYSLAMACGEALPAAAPGDLRILGVDVNPAMLARARAGIYTAWSLRETPEWALRRHFHREGSGYRLDDGVRAAVAFERRNLAEPNDDLWQAEAFDAIFCRNVLMYLVPGTAARLVARMARALAPGGHLFLGHAETLRGLSDAFELRHTHGTFYYRRPAETRVPPGSRPGGAPAADGSGRFPPAAPAFPASPSPPGCATSPEAAAAPPETEWMEAIRRATDRIADLAGRAGAGRPGDGGAAPAAPGAPAGPAGAPGADLADSLQLLRQERFSDAWEALRRRPARPDGGPPEAALLEAVLLVHMGRRAEAEAACGRLLAGGASDADAHYALALCREQAGDAEGAEDHDGKAILRDAAFAMPWLHLGLMARRQGRHADADRRLARARELLAREDASRILLFGGGFGREALMQLCRGADSALPAGNPA